MELRAPIAGTILEKNIAVGDIVDTATDLLKIAEGGWFPLVLGLFVFTVMTTWRRGREIAKERLQVASVPIESFVKSLEAYPLARVPGTGIFMAGKAAGATEQPSK